MVYKRGHPIQMSNNENSARKNPANEHFERIERNKNGTANHSVSMVMSHIYDPRILLYPLKRKLRQIHFDTRVCKAFIVVFAIFFCFFFF